jgi:hypothetical protein
MLRPKQQEATGMLALPQTRPVAYAVAPEETLGASLLVRETRPADTPKPRLLDRVRQAIRARHYSRRTEKAYVHWIKRYIFFHDKRHPMEMGAVEVTEFLTGQFRARWLPPRRTKR